jgi:hypothetical protein
VVNKNPIYMDQTLGYTPAAESKENPKDADWEYRLGPAWTTSSNMAGRWLMGMKNSSIQLHDMANEEVVSRVNTMVLQLQATAEIWVINAQTDARCTIMIITQHNITSKIALLYHEIIFIAAWSVYKWISDMKGNELWKRLKIPTICLVWCMLWGYLSSKN